MSRNVAAFCASVVRRTPTDGISRPRSAVTAATCIAVGNTSFDDWPMLTWSLGWTLRPMPRSPPKSSLARLAMTSFTFMFVWVPLPVCQTTSGNSASCLPAITSSAAVMIARPIAGSLNLPRSRFTWAAARFTRARAWISSIGIRSSPILKFSSERWVCAPQSRSAGTFISPIVSVSMRNWPVMESSPQSERPAKDWILVRYRLAARRIGMHRSSHFGPGIIFRCRIVERSGRGCRR